MNSTTSSASLLVDDLSVSDINVFTMLIALGFPADVAAVAASPDTFTL